MTFENLQGTWMYVNLPRNWKVIMLKNVAGSLAATEAEKKMKGILRESRYREGVFNYVFNSDSTFTSALKRGSLKGTYSVSPEDKTGDVTVYGWAKQLDCCIQCSMSSFLVMS